MEIEAHFLVEKSILQMKVDSLMFREQTQK
jgi:hypothetical protein